MIGIKKCTTQFIKLAMAVSNLHTKHFLSNTQTHNCTFFISKCSENTSILVLSLVHPISKRAFRTKNNKSKKGYLFCKNNEKKNIELRNIVSNEIKPTRKKRKCSTFQSKLPLFIQNCVSVFCCICCLLKSYRWAVLWFVYEFSVSGFYNPFSTIPFVLSSTLFELLLFLYIYLLLTIIYR